MPQNRLDDHVFALLCICIFMGEGMTVGVFGSLLAGENWNGGMASIQLQFIVRLLVH